MADHHHRAGTLKQSNKKHKGGGHFSKRAIDRVNLGRVEEGTARGSGGSVSRRSVKSLSGLIAIGKANRVNHAKQLQDQRKAEALVQRRLAGGYGPPKNICIVRLGPSANPAGVSALLACLADDVSVPADWASSGCPLTLTFHAFRQRLLLCTPPQAGESLTSAPGAAAASTLRYDVTHTLSGVHGADIIVVVVDLSLGTDNVVDAHGDLLLTCVRAVGVPTVIGVIQGLGSLPTARVAESRKWAHRLFATEFGDSAKLVEADCPRALQVPSSLASAGSSAAMSLTAAVADATASGAALQLARVLCRFGVLVHYHVFQTFASFESINLFRARYPRAVPLPRR
jgi:hypothetical protein